MQASEVLHQSSKAIMGLIKDAIGSALGANQVNNGFNGPSLPFRNKSNQYNQQDTGRLSPLPSPDPYVASGHRYSSRVYYSDAEQSAPYEREDGRYNPPRPRSIEPGVRDPSYRRDNPFDGPRNVVYGEHLFPDPKHWPPMDAPPSYASQYENPSYDPTQERRHGNARQVRDLSRSASVEFRPFVLPQITYGQGQPFLRGFSDELRRYGISEKEFIEAVDAINVAAVPSPEVQIFQKGANIAGWFLWVSSP